MSPSLTSRARKRKRRSTNADDDERAVVAFEFTQGALDTLRDTLEMLESILKDDRHELSKDTRTFQLEAMTIQAKIMELHMGMLSTNPDDADVDEQARFYLRKACELQGNVSSLRPRNGKCKTAVKKIKIKVKSHTRRSARDDSDAAKATLEKPTADVKQPVETADMSTQTITDSEQVLPKVSIAIAPYAQAKVSRIPRFFLETLSDNRYEEFTVEEVATAFALGSRLADFLQGDAFFRHDYAHLFGGLVGDLWNRYTQRPGWDRDPQREEALKKKWFTNGKELGYAHYALEVLEVWRARRDTEAAVAATTKPLYWALDTTQKEIAYGVRWMRYLKVTEPVATLIACTIVESKRRQ